MQIEIPVSDKYDDCNVLVLPSTKRKTKVIKEKKSNQRILSKSQRKKLEKIVDSKKKKANVRLYTLPMFMKYIINILLLCSKESRIIGVISSGSDFPTRTSNDDIININTN